MTHTPSNPWVYEQCWKFPQVSRSEADNFVGGLGTFCWFFFNFMFMIWDDLRFKTQGPTTLLTEFQTLYMRTCVHSKQVSMEWTSNHIPQYTVRCNYLSRPQTLPLLHSKHIHVYALLSNYMPLKNFMCNYLSMSELPVLLWPSGSKLLPEPMLTQFCGTIWHH